MKSESWDGIVKGEGWDDIVKDEGGGYAEKIPRV
jgi:hypothetical protein